MFCCSSTICHSTHSLYVTVTLSLYLPLLLYNLFVAPMLFSCANTCQFPSFCITISRSLCLSLSLHLGHPLCLFFSTILISHYTSIILNSGKKLCWIFLLLMKLMKIIKWQKIILLLMAYEKLIHLIIIHKIIT